MKIIERILAPDLKRLASTYKVLTIFGPRQAGKSTLAKKVFQEYEFINLEDSALSMEAIEDPKGFLINHPSPLIIDEILHNLLQPEQPQLIFYRSLSWN